MWEVWLAVSAASFGAAGYFALRRRQYRYAPKTVVYSAGDMPKKSPLPPQDSTLIDAQYSTAESAAQEPLPMAGFFGGMEKTAPEQSGGAGAPMQPQFEAAADDDEKKPGGSKFRKIRFFDS